MSTGFVRLETPSPVVVEELPAAAVVSIIVGFLLLIMAFSFLAYCIPLYIFYTEKPRRQYLYTYSKEDTQCCTVLCTQLSKAVISGCCPSLKNTIENTNLYTQNFSHVQVTQTGRTGSIFMFKENPGYGVNHLQTDESSHMLLPEYHVSTFA